MKYVKEINAVDQVLMIKESSDESSRPNQKKMGWKVKTSVIMPVEKENIWIWKIIYIAQDFLWIHHDKGYFVISIICWASLMYFMENDWPNFFFNLSILEIFFLIIRSNW